MHDYIVKESPRAKYVRIKLSLYEGLVVVVPRGFDHDRIPALVREKIPWIERKSAELAARRESLEMEPPGTPPGKLVLRSLDEEWTINYQPQDSSYVTAVERVDNRLIVLGRTANLEACEAVLRLWLRRKALEDIRPWLTGLAGEYGFEVNRVSVRLQRTRWASCSSANNVSLNLKLLFLPRDLVHYVLMHELCHTVHPNHSLEFWNLLGHHLPDYAGRNRALRAAWRYVPAWLEGPSI